MKYLASSVCTLLIAACGSTQPHGSPQEEPTPTVTQNGHTGFENTSWGMTSSALQETYPGTVAGTGMLLAGKYQGRPASVLFKLDNDALVAIDVAFTETYASMDACGTDWAKVRAELDRTLGRSQADNLAAYWEGPTRDVTLSCEPSEAEGAMLHAHFAPHHAE